ncbi:MAG: hypothetical protein JST04_00870 [Bdellovibrionales bacterium]|nr:hypothetical protein [Bdellovibrionales bacterium]
MTQQQFLLLYLLRWKEHDKDKALELIKLYKKAFPTDNSKNFMGKEQFEDLIRRGFMTRIDPNRTDVDNLVIGEKFTHIFVDEYEAGNEFWDKYPPIITSEGRNYPMKMMDKNEFRRLYWKAIKGNKEEHEEVLKDLDYAISKNLVKGKIENFLKSEQWLEIRKIRLGTSKPIQGVLEGEKDFG